MIGASRGTVYRCLNTGSEGNQYIERATADELYRLLLDVQDQLNELVADDRLTLARDAERLHGTARNAVGVVVHHLDAARQVLAVLETTD
jgi:hypothetical protein